MSVPAASIGLDLMAIPDFIAGFVYNFTGANHLVEVEQCYQGSDNVLEAVEEAFDDIKGGSFIKGLEAIGNVINDFPVALKNCEAMKGDLERIEDWAAAFKNPAEVAKTASKNWLRHHKAIKADIALDESDWTGGNYFAAGSDTAAIVTLLLPVEPFPQPRYETNDAEAAVDFLGGFLAGFVEDDHLDEI